MFSFLQLALAGAGLAALVSHPAAAQAGAPTAGRLHYEFTQRVDQQKVKVRMFDTNGQEMKLDAPGSTIELPTALSGQRNLVYRGSLAREEQAQGVHMAGGNINVTPDKSTGAPPPKLPPTVVETQYFDLAARTATTVATLGEASYRLPARPVPAPPAGWQDLPQTRKIAGFQCHKATVPFNQETYTLWVTTELPFAYSPVRELTPVRGVVLALSSDQEEYTATRLTAEPIAEATVQPDPQARLVTEAELKELQAKNQADLRQRLLEQYSGASQR